MKVTSGISRTGGKFRLVNTLLQYVPKHDYFLSCFLGSGIFEINKPRVKFEVFNDIDSELINYFLMIREHPKEFDELKQGVFGLVSQEIFNRIVSGKLIPRDDLERAYFFFYLNKCSFGGICKSYRGIKPLNSNIEKNNESGYIGVSIKTTRPFTNNDMGMLTPLNKETIKRLRYTNLTSYPFNRAYELFEKGLLKKDITDTVFLYFDPPYVGTEGYYNSGFGQTEHNKLIEILLNTKFKVMLSIGGDCEDLYIDPLKDAGFIIEELKVRYSTAANHQKESTEWLIMNYDINQLPLMTHSTEQNTMEAWLK